MFAIYCQRISFRPGVFFLLAGMLWAGTAEGQFVPYPCYDGGWAGGMALYSSSYQSAAQQQVYQQNRQSQDRSTMARSQAWRQINNSMTAQAQSRTQSINQQNQSAQDWWYQTQLQQAARRPSASSWAPPPQGNVPAAAQTTEVAAAAPPQSASQEIMTWPTLLKGEQFAERRNLVEAPFRRGYANHQPLSVADYEGVIAAVKEMKATLALMKPQLLSAEYETVEAYLNGLISDAEKRLASRKAKAAP
jgi:hypothetical protein